MYKKWLPNVKVIMSMYVVTIDASYTVIANVVMNGASMFTVSSNQLYKPYNLITPMYFSNKKAIDGDKVNQHS